VRIHKYVCMKLDRLSRTRDRVIAHGCSCWTSCSLSYILRPSQLLVTVRGRVREVVVPCRGDDKYTHDERLTSNIQYMSGIHFITCISNVCTSGMSGRPVSNPHFNLQGSTASVLQNAMLDLPHNVAYQPYQLASRNPTSPRKHHAASQCHSPATHISVSNAIHHKTRLHTTSPRTSSPLPYSSSASQYHHPSPSRPPTTA